MKTYGRFSLVVSHGKGCTLWDTDGKQYLDFAAGISTCCLGHADARLVAAVDEQMKRVHHVSNLYYIPQQGELARRLVDSCCADRAFFCNSGAEANEAAIKLARKHAHAKLGATEPVIITALNSFHGRTLATITATGQPKYQEGFGPLVPGFEYVPYNDIDALRKMVKRIHRNPLKRGRKLAAIMMEPLQGEGGITPATTEFYKAARELCDEHGALLMADEVCCAPSLNAPHAQRTRPHAVSPWCLCSRRPCLPPHTPCCRRAYLCRSRRGWVDPARCGVT
jgi:acetylornithine/N-succinyldiaminopimelate aminotransferase